MESCPRPFCARRVVCRRGAHIHERLCVFLADFVMRIAISRDAFDFVSARQKRLRLRVRSIVSEALADDLLHHWLRASAPCQAPLQSTQPDTWPAAQPPAAAPAAFGPTGASTGGGRGLDARLAKALKALPTDFDGKQTSSGTFDIRWSCSPDCAFYEVRIAKPRALTLLQCCSGQAYKATRYLDLNRVGSPEGVQFVLMELDRPYRYDYQVEGLCHGEV